MKEPSASVGSPSVPAFLMKLWALVEDLSTSDVITWSWNGENVCILDDQRFSKEILPKYFKHNNLSSFIRQLNMYGFRKVMGLENGLMTSDRGTCIEFQHPFFKRGKAELLENIKRKLSSVKSEDPHLTQEELQKVITELQDLKDVQSNVDTKLENMRRENKALWKEVSLLRKRHNQQQKLLSKVLQFILSLMRGNIVLAPNRKRQLTLESMELPPPKYSRHMLQIPEGLEEEVLYSSQNPGSSADTMLDINEMLRSGEGTSEASIQNAEPVQRATFLPSTSVGVDDSVQAAVIDDSVLQSLADQNLNPSKSNASDELALDVVQASTSEDPDSVINSILNEDCTLSNTDLDQADIQDFLSCIDASLEELQDMLSRKKLNVDSDVIDELFKPDLSSSDIPVAHTDASLVDDLLQNSAGAAMSGGDGHLNKDKQLMQYRGNPLLSLLDLPSNNSEASSIDPGVLLSPLEDGLYPSRSAEPLVEDVSRSDELPPIFVLSPVNKLLEEVTNSETLE